MNNNQEKSNFDLFNNPMVTAAKKSMSPSSIERYRRLGESMYNGINFSKNSVNDNNQEIILEEALKYIEESLKSGIHPSMLLSNEKEILATAHGDQWFKKWDYVESDLNSIFTVKW
jgi:hypothetical protein